jgi:hypothetical protein
MPNVANVQLQIGHSATNLTPAAQRNVSVSYDLGFTQPEIDAKANFHVNVSLQGADDATDLLPVASFNVTAVSGTVSRTEQTHFQRRQLDEEPDVEVVFDSQGHPHRIASEEPDAWKAQVAVTYVPTVFGNANGTSAVVGGSWGAQGHD